VHEQEFIRHFVGQQVADAQQARQALRRAVLATVDQYIETSWHLDDAFASLDAVVAGTAAHSGKDVARALSLSADLGDPLQETVMSKTVLQREIEVRQLRAQAGKAIELLRELGATLPFDPVVDNGALNAQQVRQVLQSLLDEGSTRFRRFVRRLERDPSAQPQRTMAEEIQRIGLHYVPLRRSAAALGRLPDESHPAHALPVRAPGEVWDRQQVERVFRRGEASGARNVCWFDSLAQLALGTPRGEGSEALVEHLALRLRHASDRLGLSREGEMVDDDNGGLHVIAATLQLQVHTFRTQPDETLRLTPLQSIGSPSRRGVYLECNDVHFVPLWRSAAAGSSEGAGVGR
jgi:hypothetical protein